jgi:hypothetical protein
LRELLFLRLDASNMPTYLLVFNAIGPHLYTAPPMLLGGTNSAEPSIDWRAFAYSIFVL